MITYTFALPMTRAIYQGQKAVAIISSEGKGNVAQINCPNDKWRYHTFYYATIQKQQPDYVILEQNPVKCDGC